MRMRRFENEISFWMIAVDDDRRPVRGGQGRQARTVLREMKMAKGKNTLLWPGAKRD